MNLNKYLRMKEKIESLQREADKAEGAAEQSLKRLQKDFGCKSLEEAKRLIEEREEEQRKLEKEYEKEETRFRTKWKDTIEDHK